jgi:hypothetical protein
VGEDESRVPRGTQPWHNELNRLDIRDKHLHELTTDLILSTHVDDLHPIVGIRILG